MPLTQAKLKRLGSDASAALLAIPAAQQLELSRSAEAGAPRQREPKAPALPGLDAALDAGVSLEEVVEQATRLAAESGAVRSGEPGSALAVAPPPSSQDAGGAARAADEASASARASVLSLVALRLSSGAGAEDARQDALHAASTDSVARLALVVERLERRRSQLQVEQSLASLDLGEGDG